jgi:hypothetical protein
MAVSAEAFVKRFLELVGAAGWAETSVEVTNNAACAEVAEFLKGAGG